MKADARRIADAVATWPKTCRLVLLYGPDMAASTDHATRLQRQFADPANPSAVTLLTGVQVAADPQALVAAAAEMSMFGDRIVVRVDGATEDALEAIKGLLDGPAGNPAIVVAGALKKGPLVSLAETHPEILSLQSYEPTARDAVALVGGIATEAGLRPTQAAARAIFEAANGDRATIRQEVEKLALYLDPPPAGGTRPVEMTDVAAVGAGVGDGDWDSLVGAVAGGDGATVATLLPRLDAKGEAGIGALRAMQRRLWLLIDLRAAVDAGTSPDQAVKSARPPVFWKLQDEVIGQLRKWRTPELHDAAHRVLAAERAIKSSGSAGEILAAQVLLDLSHRV